MASDLLRTPVAEVRWCKLLGDARTNKFEPSTKPPTWEIEIVLDNDNPEHMAFCEFIEAQYEVIHGAEKKHAHWLPIKPDKEQPRKRQACRFKLSQFTFKDGNKSEGPVVYDEKGRYWPEEKLIGNGSKMRIGFDIYGWKSPTGCGMTLQPKGAQVVEWLAAPDKKPTTAADFGFDVSPEAEAENSAIPF